MIRELREFLVFLKEYRQTDNKYIRILMRSNLGENENRFYHMWRRWKGYDL